MLTPEEEANQDVFAAMAYLGGVHENDKRGVPRQRFYKERTTEALFCRAALARVLRSDGQLDRQLRDMLAAMFDPWPTSTSPWSERMLRAGSRAAKKSKDHMANTHIAYFVWERVRAGVKVQGAVKEAMDHFRHPSRDDLSERRIYRLWSIYRPKFELIYGSIDPPPK